MEAELKNVNDQLKDNKLEKFATACDTAGTKMESFGKKMSVVSAGIAGIGAASIKAFTELDEGYDTIVTKTGATGEALEGLTKSADNVFGTMPEDMSTVGEAIGEVNTRFHTTGTELEKTSKQFIQFATINGTNVTQSVDQVDKIMKAWNVDASQTGNLLGLLTAKAQETGISVDTLEGYVLDNNAQFKEMGLSLPQAINLMAQFDAIKACLEFAFEGTGWHVGICTVTKKRTIDEQESVTAWDVLQKCLTTYRCECIIHSLTKTIDIYDRIGSDKGCYFMEGLNLRKISLKSDTYDFYTRIYPIGKDGITPEWLTGKDYIDNFQYSSKIKAYVWKDERYTNTTSLIEDATAKIEEMSRPYKAYTAEVVDLAKASEEYKDILSYGIGDRRHRGDRVRKGERR